MIILILAGGYGRRLAPLTDYHAKSLLSVVGRPIIEWTLDKLPSEKILISTNRRFLDSFKEWIGNRAMELVCEETTREEEKLGAVGGLLYTIRKKRIDEPVLVVNGDNLFDFSLKDFLESDSAVNLLYDIKDVEEVKGKYGNALMEDGFIVQFLEKPQNPVSSLVSTGIYYFPPPTFRLIEEFYQDPTKDTDNMGSLLKWMTEEEKIKIKGVIKEGIWIDIGSKDSYIHANQIFSGKNSFIDTSTRLKNSTVKSSVILKGSTIVDSSLEGCIIDEDCLLEGVEFRDTIIGKGSRIVKTNTRQ